jgi:hypothetical protein
LRILLWLNFHIVYQKGEKFETMNIRAMSGSPAMSPIAQFAGGSQLAVAASRRGAPDAQ